MAASGSSSTAAGTKATSPPDNPNAVSMGFYTIPIPSSSPSSSNVSQSLSSLSSSSLSPSPSSSLLSHCSSPGGDEKSSTQPSNALSTAEITTATQEALSTLNQNTDPEQHAKAAKSVMLYLSL